jgi:hypothetical protein
MPLFLLQALPATSKTARTEQPKILAIKTGKQYRDYYGTAITSNASLLTSPTKTYRWGVTNLKPQEMAYFGGTLISDAKHSQHFRASIFVDGGLKVPVVFTFRVGDRNGEVLETYTVKPGETLPVDLQLKGAMKLFFVSELKIQHGTATRIILGEPEFE